MPKESDHHFDVLLRAEWRTPERARSVADDFKKLGVTVASQGSSSVTLRVPDSMLSDFVALARKANWLDPETGTEFATVSKSDGGTIKIPAALSEGVEMITVPRKHLQF
jgi:hypothetical protein